jgi:hypothetical protein
MTANVALDYTEWAPPPAADRVLADIQTHEMQSCRTPHKIIMWVHQWDFLTKQYAHLKLKRPAESSVGGTLWGVKVEVRDPEEHKP